MQRGASAPLFHESLGNKEAPPQGPHMPISMTASMLLACLVVGVSDGDTLTARCDQGRDGGVLTLKVRLAEIDAPERAQPFGARSKAHLVSLCFGRAAQLRAQTVDRYGRTVARVWCDGVDANAEQVRVGMAWAYERYLKDERLRVAQDAAREAQRGLWADAEPVAPWEWRRVRREGFDRRLSAAPGAGLLAIRSRSLARQMVKHL